MPIGRYGGGFPPNFFVANSNSASNRMRAALPVLGDEQWYHIGKAANWVRAHGGTLAYSGVYGTISAGSQVAHTYMVWPRHEGHARIWIVTLIASAGTSADGTITIGTPAPSTPADFTISGTKPQTFHVVQELTTKTDVPAETTVTIANSADSASPVIINAISCHEVPRQNLQSEYGVELASLTALNPIVEDQDYTSDLSIEAAARHARIGKHVARKSCQFGFYSTTGLTTTSTSLTGAFPLDCDAMPRFLESANTSRNLVWNAYAKVTGASASGEIAITSAAETVTMTVTSTTATWHKDHTISVRCEDPTRWPTDGGIRTGSRDTLTIQYRKTAGTSITIYGLSIGEADSDPLAILGSP